MSLLDQGSTLALIPSVGLTLFFGIGSIIKNNAAELPDQRLPLRTDGCYIDEPMTSFFNNSQQFTLKQNDAWKDEMYSPLTKVLSISYLWQPVIPIVGTVIFGLLFSIVINIFKRPKRVKANYMTPIILSMWIRILGVKRLQNWIDFDDDEVEQANIDAVSRDSISRDSLSVSWNFMIFYIKKLNVFICNRKGRDYRHRRILQRRTIKTERIMIAEPGARRYSYSVLYYNLESWFHLQNVGK